MVGGFVGDEKLPRYIGIIINHYKDPYQTTSIMESSQVLPSDPNLGGLFVTFSGVKLRDLHLGDFKRSRMEEAGVHP